MAFFTRAVMAASSKNELPPPEVAQPARPSSAAAMTSAKRCLSWFISPSVVKAQPDRNTAQSTSRQGKTARWGHAPAGLSRPRNARSPRQQLRQLAQRVDPRARRLPALAGEERAARALDELEIRVCGEPAHRVALAAVGLLDHGRKILPGHGSQPI